MKKLFFIFSITATCYLLPATCFAASGDLAKIQSQIKQTEQQNKQIEQQVKTSDREVASTQKQLVSAADKLSKLEAKRGAIKDKISDLDKRRDELLSSIRANKGRLADAAAGLAIISGNPSFSAADTREYILTSALLTGVSGQFDAEMKSALKKIEELEKILEERKAQQAKLDKTAQKYAEDKSHLDKLMRTRSAQNEKLKSQQYELQKKLRDLSARAKDLSELTAGLAGTRVSADESFSWRKLKAPVSGLMLRRFGEKSPLGLVSDGWLIKTRSNALVSAPADGRVEFADDFRKNGRVLIMSHKNSYYSVLTGLGSSDVLVGQEVLAGEPVGRMPDERAEMYLELRRGTKAVDPARIFNEP
ncbi:MAG: peptidoglycan DD-metalloendopeptidase family protein [Alphaproteobacteria bacterium]|nr:peptidoglycan DD-metalloendopeptidase family protein [Alphaproteobacteria bacterium]